MNRADINYWLKKGTARRCALCGDPARVGVVCDACHDSMGTKPPAAIIPDCGEYGHDKGVCGNAQCIRPPAKQAAPPDSDVKGFPSAEAEIPVSDVMKQDRPSPLY